jgi:hypothetical protein
MENNNELIKNARVASLYKYLLTYVNDSDDKRSALQDINHVATILCSEQETKHEPTTY